jgi:anti-anti-sigma factor
MKREHGKTTTPDLGTQGGAELVELVATEYGALDARELARVRSLLLGQAEKPNPPYLIVDLAGVHFFGARFIGILVDTWDRLRNHNRRLVLCGLTPNCRKVLLTLHLDKLFDIYPTKSIALEMIGQRARGSNGAARNPHVRIHTSEVAWDPHMLRMEYIGDDDVPFRCVIVPRWVVEQLGPFLDLLRQDRAQP